MPTDQPLWLRAVLRVERAIGQPVESAVRSETYFDLVTKTTRVRRKAGGAAEGLSRRALHLLNLPAGSDIRRVRQQLARVERRLDQLSGDVAEIDESLSRDGSEGNPGWMSPIVPSTLNPGDVLERVNRDVERSILRARNGVRYIRGKHRPALGVTPKDVVWRSGKAQLWRYKGGDRRYGPPVVIVHSLVSRSYILDLRPGNSTVEYLIAAGLDVFMLDWGVPDELDADNDLARYVDFYMPRALAAARRVSGYEELTLAGYCLGGVLAVLYAAGHKDAKVRNLILMATPIDYSEMGAMVGLLRDGRLDPDDLVDETGNVPADALYSGFYMLAPTSEVAQKATLLENLWNDEFVEGFQAMATWSRDHVPFPGAAFRELTELLVRQNILMTGAISLGDRQVQLADVQGNVLNAMAERDNVVPPSAVAPAMALIGDPARREELRLPGGHVTFGTGRSAFKHTMPKLTRWIIDHSDPPS